MPHYMYVSLQDDDKILVFGMDAGTGKLTPKAEVPVAGGPSASAISPDRRALYVGHRTSQEMSSYRIDPETGGLTQIGVIKKLTPILDSVSPGYLICYGNEGDMPYEDVMRSIELIGKEVIPAVHEVKLRPYE